MTSCLKPNFPYAPLHGNRIKGFDLLADYLWPQAHEDVAAKNVTEGDDSEETALNNNTAVAITTTQATPADFMLFLGDFVYADVPYYYGDDKEAYRRLYRRNYQSRSFRKVYERLRAYFAVNVPLCSELSP